jgi:hypothetical protein
MSRKLNGQIELHKLAHVLMTKKGKSGNPVKGMFIPFEVNNIEVIEKDDNTFINVPIVVWTNDEANEHGQHGSIKQSLSSEKYKSMEKEAAIALSKDLPYLANLKDFSGTSNETTNNIGDGKVYEDDGDDLPF